MPAQFPNCLYHLWAAFDGVPIPPYAEQVRDIVMEAMQSPEPQTVLNNKFRWLKLRKDEPLKALHAWLLSQETYRQVKQARVHWAWSIWHKAIREILASENTAHEVFGMDKPGTGASNSFANTKIAGVAASGKAQAETPTKRRYPTGSRLTGVPDRETQEEILRQQEKPWGQIVIGDEGQYVDRLAALDHLDRLVKLMPVRRGRRVAVKALVEALEALNDKGITLACGSKSKAVEVVRGKLKCRPASARSVLRRLVAYLRRWNLDTK